MTEGENDYPSVTCGDSSPDKGSLWVRRRKGERYMKATGERWERRLWREERPERVAAVGERRSRTVGKESTGHRNRDCTTC